MRLDKARIAMYSFTIGILVEYMIRVEFWWLPLCMVLLYLIVDLYYILKKH